MIYFLAEFCLNSLNGTFFESTTKLQKSLLPHARYAPFVSLYILIFGFNTLNVSVVLSQLLFLYNIFHTLDETFIRVTNELINKKENPIGSIIMKIIKNIPIIPFSISLCLNGAYISYSNRVNSLLSRILYTMSAYICNSLLEEFIVVKICEFGLSYLVNNLFSKFYLVSELKTSALIFSFSGTYFFLKTHQKNAFFSFMKQRKFNFSFKFFEFPSNDELESYLIFMLIFLISFLTQMLIRSMILKIARKNKRD